MTTYYVSADSNNDTDKTNSGAINSPWSLSYAAKGAKNSTQIQPGDTVLVGGGTYHSDTGFTISVSGGANNKITFKAHPGETVILDGSLPEFAADRDDAWKPDDALSPGHNVYYSVGDKYSAPGSTFYGGFIKIGDEWFSLAQHKLLDYLESPRQEGYDPDRDPQPFSRYLGPGVAQENGHIIIRLDNSDPRVQLERPVPQISDPDPRNHKIYLCRSDRFGLKITGSHLVIEGFTEINYFGGCIVLEQIQSGQTDVTVRNCGGRPTYFGMRCAYIDGLTLDSCKFYAHMPSDRWWVSYADIKGSDAPADHVRKLGLDLGVATHVEVVNCLFDEFFDGTLATIKKDVASHNNVTAHNIEIHHTTFNHIWDDAWQMNAQIHHINFHHNFCYGAGPSVNAPGTNRPNKYPGTVYIHHNVIDTTTRLVFWGRCGSPSEGSFESIPLSSHVGGASPKGYTWPRKLYYNTIKTGKKYDPNHLYVGWSIANTGATHRQARHEVFNNIFLVIDGRPGGRDFDTTSRQEIYDGNVFWHYSNESLSGYKSPWHRLHIIDKRGKVQILNLEVLAKREGQAITVTRLRELLVYVNWQAYYSPGWEHSGLSEDPQLDGAYRPRNPFCKIGAVNLTKKGWPGAEKYEAWRGAITPLSRQNNLKRRVSTREKKKSKK